MVPSIKPPDIDSHSLIQGKLALLEAHELARRIECESRYALARTHPRRPLQNQTVIVLRVTCDGQDLVANKGSCFILME